jgi:cytochrome c peroxidase
VKRERTQSLLVAAEGLDAIVELDALSVDPTSAVMRTYAVGGGVDPYLRVATTCGAPQGIALSADEATAYVLCRSTYDVAAVTLDPHAGAAFAPVAPVVDRFADDPLDNNAATGRRIFYNATDAITSGGLACSGCHPEGRDDGHVWHEARFNTSDGTNVNFVGIMENLPEEERVKGYARRTPLLVGRIAAGPYGWHAESPDAPTRLVASFGLHRWGGLPAQHQKANLDARASFLAEFLRRGLVPPPREERPLTPEEQRGKEIFLSEATRCAKCHVPETDYTDRMAYPLPRRLLPPDFDDEPNAAFKTPSLNHLDGHPPYFHDGTAATLEELIERNADRMGKTAHLSGEERAALVAFLRTL